MEKSSVDVVVLCGGFGTRLQTALPGQQKTMAPLESGPFLDLVINSLTAQGFRKFILCTGYQADAVEKYFSAKKGPARFLFSRETEPLGTAGAVKNARLLVTSDTLLVTNGDSFCDINYADFMEFHRKKGALMSLALVPPRLRTDGGYVRVDANNAIVSFNEKIYDRNSYLNAGVYLIHSAMLELIKKVPCSWEKDVFPERIHKGLFGFIADTDLFDIGTPERLESFRKNPPVSRF